jgi:predicted anti-sigma-YlaC factor YlaD
MRLDGEVYPDEARVSRHLEVCAMCAAWLQGAQRVTRIVRVQPVAVPDLTERIMVAAQAAGVLAQQRKPREVRSTRQLARLQQLARLRGFALVPALRWALGALATVQIMLALPDLLGATGHDAHAAREVAASGVALAVGLLLVACYPAYARVFAPVVMTLVLCFAAISAVDLVEGAVGAGRVAGHGLAVAQALLVWHLAKRSPSRPVPA